VQANPYARMQEGMYGQHMGLQDPNMMMMTPMMGHPGMMMGMGGPGMMPPGYMANSGNMVSPWLVGRGNCSSNPPASTCMLKLTYSHACLLTCLLLTYWCVCWCMLYTPTAFYLADSPAACPCCTCYTGQVQHDAPPHGLPPSPS
jgi:hypothetical protein